MAEILLVYAAFKAGLTKMINVINWSLKWIVDGHGL
jgi:hypothetical protein